MNRLKHHAFKYILNLNLALWQYILKNSSRLECCHLLIKTLKISVLGKCVEEN